MKPIAMIPTKETAWNALDHAAATIATCAMKAKFLTGDFRLAFKDLRRDKQLYLTELAQQYILAAHIVEKMGAAGVHEALLLLSRQAAILFNQIATESNERYAKSEPIKAAMQMLQAFAGQGPAQEGPKAPPPAAPEGGAPDCSTGVHVFREDGTCYGCNIKVEPPAPGYEADDLDNASPLDRAAVESCTSYDPCTNYECRTCWPEGKPS